MSFEYAVSQALSGEKRADSRMHMSSKDRPNMSLSKIQEGDNYIEINAGQIKRLYYSEWHGERFLFARSLNTDVLFTLFEVNSAKLVAFRGAHVNSSSIEKIKAEARKILSKKPNLESRIFGFSNGSNLKYIKDLLHLSQELKARLVEVDAFGNEFRHIAIDSRFGISYNVLLDNRPYRAGELMVNQSVTPANNKQSLAAVLHTEQIVNNSNSDQNKA